MKRITAIFFLLTFCFSTLGYSFELHYCKGEMTDISLFGHAECICGGVHEHNDKNLPEPESCSKHCHETVGDENEYLTETGKCCKTEKLTFVSGSLKALSQHTMPDFQFVLAAIFNPYIFTGFCAATAKSMARYAPPILERDINVLYRTFLI